MGKTKLMCGEIFRDSEGLLSFKCSICCEELEMIAEYAMHLDEHFQIVVMIPHTSTADEAVSAAPNPPMHDGIDDYDHVVNINDDSDNNDDYFGDRTVNSEDDFHFASYDCRVENKLPKAIPQPLHISAKAISQAPLKRKMPPPTPTCKHCLAKFKSKGGLTRHMERYQNFKEKFTCKMCNASFAGGCLLATHLHKKHRYKQNKNRFKCELCPKIFGANYQLKSHMYRHSGVKPYKCDICQKSFPQLSYIAIHMRYHTGERPFQCTICGDLFLTSSKLSYHVRRHNNDLNRHKCTVCDRGFKYPAKLKEHMNLHLGVKPFTCEVCGKSFTFERNLKVHRRHHYGEKPYKCRYCDLRFSQSSNKRVHEKQEHEYDHPIDFEALR